MTPRLATALGLLALVACKSSGDDFKVTGDDMPSHPGSGTNPDATTGTSDSIDGGGTSGRVCLAADSRDLTACAGTGAGGFLVTQGSGLGSGVTTDDGSFDYAGAASVAPWTVTGGAIVESVTLTSTPGEIPALTTDLYNSMVANTGGSLLGNGQGVLIARIRTTAGSAAVGARVTSGDAVTDVFYDTADDTTWADDQDTGTGTFGDAWIPVEPEGTISITVTPAGSTTPITVNSIAIVDQAITYITVTVP